jgi:hypothetical protein
MGENRVVITEERSTAARAAAHTALTEQVGSSVVGDHLRAEDEGAGLVTHYFACAQSGYRGWEWAATVSVLPGQDEITVDDAVLLPGPEAIVAPAWVPWRERIKPGDLSPGDVLPTDEDDPRLVPAYLSGDPGDDVVEPTDRQQQKLVADELGLGRSRVLSLEGRDLAAQRWYDGGAGPEVPLAQNAPGKCWTCGFLVRLGGPLSDTFGVCANEYANDDGRVVAFNHGCGAHSEAQLRKKQLPPPLPDPVLDTIGVDEFEGF